MKAALLLALLAFEGAARGGTPPSALQVTLDLAGSRGPLKAELRVEPETAGGRGAQDTRKTASYSVEVPGERSIQLPPGLWKLSASAEGWWSESRLVDAASGAEAIRLRLSPAAVLTARIEVSANQRPPDLLTVHFKTPPSGAGKATIIEGEETCDVKEGAWRCGIAAGRWDLRLKAEGAVPVYFWGIEAAAHQEAKLGPIPMRRGASIAGWVEVPGASPAACRVSLQPTSAGVPEGRQALERLGTLAREEKVNERGFFQFKDVAPGSYTLTTSLQGFAPAEVSSVVVKEGLESQLVKPLVLTRPIPFEVVFDPPVDPYGQPWRVQLFQVLEGAAKARGRSYRGTASAEGTWSQKNLTPGHYRLFVLGEGESRWAAEEIAVQDGDSSHRVEIPVLAVRGRLSLGKEPLGATLWFGGKSGSRRVRFDSDENGRFQGFLPSEGLWRIEVVKEAEGLRLALHPVEVKRHSGKRWAELSLELPDTLVQGEVVDEAGKEVSTAGVSSTYLADRTVTQLISDAKGHFKIRGLQPGATVFEAESGEQASGPVPWSVEDGHESPLLRLTVRAKAEVRGRILSSQGPVPGAEILAWPDFSQAPLAGIESSVTGPDGTYRISVPAGSQALNLLVLAPGSALRMLRAPVVSGQPLDIPVEPQGGTLVIQLRKSGGKESGTPLLLHNGTFALLPLLARWVTLQGGTEGQDGRVILESVEAGDYSLCGGGIGALHGTTPAASCQSGYLAVGGELVLGLPGRPAGGS